MKRSRYVHVWLLAQLLFGLACVVEAPEEPEEMGSDLGGPVEPDSGLDAGSDIGAEDMGDGCDGVCGAAPQIVGLSPQSGAAWGRAGEAPFAVEDADTVAAGLSLSVTHGCSFDVSVQGAALVFVCGDAVETCEATVSVSDGGSVAQAQTTINCTNTPPQVADVTIEESAGSLRCVYSYMDAEGDADASTVEWFIDGVSVGQGPTLADTFDAGALTCKVSPRDGLASGVSVDSAPLVRERFEASVGDAHICAIRGDALWCWGSNTMGQLGTNQGAGTYEQLPPVKVLASGVTHVSAGTGVTCAIQRGALKCWGNPATGMLTLQPDPLNVFPQHPDPVEIFAEGVTDVAVGHSHVCAVHQGSAKCWGTNARSVLGLPTEEGLTPEIITQPRAVLTGDVTAIEAGNSHSCALQGGQLKCWGNNSVGELGVGMADLTHTHEPQALTLPGVVTKIFAQSGNTCALLGDQLWCWGSNGDGQLNPDQPASEVAEYSPRQVYTSGVSDVGIGSYHLCAKHLGFLKCSGGNASGQLGIVRAGASVTDVAAPLDMLGGYIGDVTGGHQNTCAVHAGELKCWGENRFSQLGVVGGQHSKPRQLETQRSVERVVSGLAHSCALNAGALYCWGKEAGQSSINLFQPAERLKEVFPSGVTDVALGASHTCAIRQGELLCFGENSNAQLGFTGPATTTPRRVFAAGTTLIAAGSSHTCAVHESVLKCWGNNREGQTGATPTTANSPVPYTVLSQGVTAVALGGDHSCAVQSGALKCWGRNNFGQLGVALNAGTNTPLPAPQTVFSSGVSAVAAGGGYTCAVHNNALKCWGLNGAGQLGVSTGFGTRVAHPAPLTVFSGGVTAITTGASHTCAIRTGDAWCWGANVYGERAVTASALAVQDVLSYAPTLVLAGATSISAGRQFTCAAKASSPLCWGNNDMYQLGYGDLAKNKPVTLFLP
jgi:alpha-tubulin suppressor-like RCC1 family protein